MVLDFLFHYPGIAVNIHLTQVPHRTLGVLAWVLLEFGSSFARENAFKGLSVTNERKLNSLNSPR